MQSSEPRASRPAGLPAAASVAAGSRSLTFIDRLGMIKALRMLWDLFFGVSLIGGAPWSVIALQIIIGDLVQSVFHLNMIPNSIFTPIMCVTMLAALAAFVFAIRFRVRRRVLPAGFLALEILLGLAGAFLLFMLYGVITYSIIG